MPKNGKNLNSKHGQKIDAKKFKLFDIFQTEKDDEMVERMRGKEKSEKPWTSVHQLNPNGKYFDQNFGKTEIQEIEEKTGKEWTNKWEEKIKQKIKKLKIEN